MTTTPHHLSDRYQLGETLGFGGMSEVHFARDLLLNRDVAIKVLRADLARDPSFYLRFRREAQNAAKLNHPTIVQVFDTGEAETEDGPLPFIVMEYVEGETLRDILRADGPLSPRQALTWMADVAAAMDFSHRASIVHRDMKPANVMIDRTGAVKVMDFGIARAMNDTSATMTQTSAVMGTAQYLSPEQARGLKVDPRSDIYSMGCVLFELLTGEPPFTGDSPVAVAHQHVHEDPPLPSDLRGDIPPELDSVILKAISKNPANRYQSAAEFRADLIRVLSGQRPAAPMIMSAAERTDLIDTGPRAMVRPTPGGRHDTDDDSGRNIFRQRRLRAGAIIGAVILLLGSLIIFQPWSGPAAQVSVPSVEQVPEQPAQELLERSGFRVKTMQESSLDVPAGIATRTTPGAGVSAEEGSEVTLYVSTGPQRQKIPDVRGKTRAEAVEALSMLGFTVVKTDKVDSPPDLLDKAVNTTPPAGTDTEVNAVVVVHIGEGPKQVTIPELVGETEDRARTILKQLGVKMTVVPGDSEMPRGQVVTTSPPAGSTIAADETVTVTISRGNMFIVPNLIGKTPGQARAALAAAGWRVSTLTQSTRGLPLGHRSDGRVVAQDPPAGSAIRKDDGVSIVVGQGRLIG
ncbi:serine/threonine protein kinase PknB [Gordonia araii NBRC 100433]|uniref:non-specific serine/threonine protein kinase n=1 Tax=Gordonia araii NBRC 100433 TaxID=1073574 RepID=G7H075_9ACTN|nr:Stk1 family PASTA domain-containing Ser/Thr kinase [Gordonia araii]NNG97272.1 Stk1 family PASTA domain-containing Ser/Thr kinase [Gordonia araii NBRC 100433]GAB09250.1 serine/threonine protein kinase PknB [Gordonia araii NBRC 100433]